MIRISVMLETCPMQTSYYQKTTSPETPRKTRQARSPFMRFSLRIVSGPVHAPASYHRVAMIITWTLGPHNKTTSLSRPDMKRRINPPSHLHQASALLLLLFLRRRHHLRYHVLDPSSKCEIRRGVVRCCQCHHISRRTVGQRLRSVHQTNDSAVHLSLNLHEWLLNPPRDCLAEAKKIPR
ncbi:hypothetical protein BC827DRAFT_1216741 [Russula dissimulans]|nr:hypothetical protein BC827DRAFT_1216741 [Russula dissimulans]